MAASQVLQVTWGVRPMSVQKSSVSLSRRQILSATGLVGAAAVVQSARPVAPADDSPSPRRVQFCLNTSTIRGQKLSVPEQVDVAGKAGFDAIEPWLGELHKYVETGGSLKDLKKRLDDHGLTVASAIGFAEWIVDDDAKRASGLEVAKKDMA